MLNKIDFIEYAHSTDPTKTRHTCIGFDFTSSLKELATSGLTDVAILSPEDGFSPLGASKNFIESDLGISYDNEIRKISEQDCWHGEKINLLAIPSKKPDSLLKGIILAPGSNCDCYRPFVRSSYSKPARDFYYNVSYEAFLFACLEWGAKNLAISHLCGSNKFHKDIANCHIEALSHFCYEHPQESPNSFIFWGCCINKQDLSEIRSIREVANNTPHRLIDVTSKIRDGNTIISLDWNKP